MWSIRVRIAKDVRTVTGNESRNISQTRGVEVSGRCERQPTLQRHDAGKLPAANDLSLEIALILEERQLVDVVGRENAMRIQGCKTTIQSDVVRILRSRAAIGLVIRDVLGPRISDVELRRVLETTLRQRLQAVIVRIELRRDHVDGTITAVRPDLIENVRRLATSTAEVSSRRLARNGRNIRGLECVATRRTTRIQSESRRQFVKLVSADQVRALRTEVTDAEDRVGAVLLLPFERPVLHVRIFPVRLERANAERRIRDADRHRHARRNW